MFWLRKSGFVRQFGHLLVERGVHGDEGEGRKIQYRGPHLRGGGGDGGGRHLDNSMKRCNIIFKG